jgi:hypothetical protein
MTSSTPDGLGRSKRRRVGGRVKPGHDGNGPAPRVLAGLDPAIHAEPTCWMAFQRVDAPRERNMKHWPRAWKVRLILQTNPGWRDLYDQLNA